MARFYLSPFIGDGTENNPFKPPSSNFNAVDLRGDIKTQAGWSVVRTPEPIADGRLYDLGDTPTGRLPNNILNQLSNRLGVSIDTGDTIGSVLAELLILKGTVPSDTTRWNRIKQDSRGRHKIILGPDVLYDAPVVVGSTVTESWTGSDTSDGDISADLTWAATRNTKFDIVSNAASYKNTSGGSCWYRAETDLASDDHYAQVVVTQDTSGTYAIVLTRHNASAVTAYYHRALIDADEVETERVVTDSFTQIATTNPATTATNTASTVLYGDIDGSAIRTLWDDNVENSTTDTNITGNTRCGVAGGANGDDRVVLDDFEAGDLAAGATFPDAPSNLTATAVSTSQINLSWDAVTGAGGYDIERDGTVIVSDQAATTYNDTGRSTGTNYSYRVRSVA